MPDEWKTPQMTLAFFTIIAIWSFVLFAGYDVDNAVTVLVGILTGMGLNSAAVANRGKDDDDG